MKVAYADTSYLVALAFDEPDATTVANRLRRFDRLVSSNLLEAELRSAVRREAVDRDPALLLSSLTWVCPNRSLSKEFARVLALGYVKGADLWHLACALLLAPGRGRVTFLTLDRRQKRIAKRLGFAT